MRKWLAFCLLLAALFAALGLVASWPAAANAASDHTYHETFTTTAHMDAAHTTARWDTSRGQLRFHPPMPRSEGVAGQLYHITAWGPAVYVPDTGLVYIFGGPGSPSAIQQYDPTTNTTNKSALRLPYPLVGSAAVYVETRDAVYLLGGSLQANIVAFDVVRGITTVLAHRLPEPLKYASAVYVPNEDKAYIFGGMAADGSERKTILQYDLTAGTVLTVPATLPISVSMTSAIYDPETNSAYIFGGEMFGYPMPSIVRFDLTDHTVAHAGLLPVPCSATSAVYVPEQHAAYIFGGQGFTEALSQTIAYDIDTRTATALPVNLPIERSGAAAVYVPSCGTAYVLGGEQWFFGSTDIVAFDVNTRTSTAITARVDGRSGASAIYADSTRKSYVFGGESLKAPVSQSILVYDVDHVSVSTLDAVLPVSRTDTAAVYDPGTNRGYVFGGMWPGDTPQYFHDIFRFDVTTETITPTGAVLPTGRAGMAAAYAPARGKAYLFGGTDQSGCLNEILIYDPAEDQLTLLPETLPTPAAYAAAVYDARTDKVYLFGGWNPDVADQHLDEIVVFDVSSETTALFPASLPSVRARAAAIAIPDESTAYVIGGSYGRWRNLTDIVRADMATGVVTWVQDISLGVRRSGEGAVYVPDKATAYLFGGTGYQSDAPLDNIIALKFAYPLSETAQSLMVNAQGEKVHHAVLTMEQSLQGCSVSYSLSNDGGQTWENVQPGVRHTFVSPGSDLRWRTTLGGNGETTPFVDSLTITYDDTEGHQVFLPVIVRAYRW